MEDVAKGLVSAAIDTAPASYLPVILMAIMFIILLAAFCWLTHIHNEKLFDKSVEAIRIAYNESMKAQNESIKMLTKELSSLAKKTSVK